MASAFWFQKWKARHSSFHWKILFITIILSSGGSFISGIALSVLNGSAFLLRNFINETYTKNHNMTLSDKDFAILWPAIITSQMVGSLIAALFFVKLTENLGRRKTFYVFSLFILVGLSLQALSKSCSRYELLPIGRFIAALGYGLSSHLEGMYYSEISPVHSRGFFCSIISIFFELGLLIGCILPLPAVFGTEALWPWMFAIQTVPVVPLLILLPFLHDSPRYLLAKGRIDECKRALKFFSYQDVEESMREIESEIECQREGVKWRELWENRYLRKGVILGILVPYAAIFSGVTVLELYSSTMLTKVGLGETAAQYATVAILGISCVGSLFGSVLVEKVGRRPLLLITNVVLIVLNVSLMGLAFVYDFYGVTWSGYFIVVVSVAIVASFAIGPAVLMWTMPVELVPQNARSTVQAITSTTRRLGLLAIGLSFYPLLISVGPYCYLINIIPLCILFLVFYFMLPETKNKPITEILRTLGYDKSEYQRLL